MAEDIEVNRRRGGLLSVVSVVSFRLSQFGNRNSGPLARIVLLLSLPLVAFTRLGVGCELSGRMAVGRRLLLAHGGRNVIFHPDAVLGDDVAVASGSGAGVAFPKPGAPVIGDGVYIGTSVSILGDITIGDGAFLGARALVLKSVPLGMCAVGMPAKVIGPAPVMP